ncbi:hypothetical protein PaeBR_06045 [Paenibacillus sp. BR2-3]|uniref:hypothetical protein n=1 Tax=Paenibacillus sp. BR2-3 TaxID=3048494 RepID=UPI0039775BEE
MNLYNRVIDIRLNQLNKMYNEATKEKPEIIRINVETSSNSEFSPLTQYFLFPFINSSADGVLHIPIFDDLTEKQVLDEVASHFQKCKVVKYKEKLQYMLSEVNISSKNQMLELISKGTFNPIAYELHQRIYMICGIFFNVHT